MKDTLQSLAQHRLTNMEETTIFYTCFSLLLLILAFKLWFQGTIYGRRRRKNLPPSPPSLPFLGHLHILKPPMHRSFHTLAQKYGPIFSLRFGFSHVLIVSSAAAAEECFGKNDVIFANRPQLTLGKYLGYNYTTLVHTDYSDHWRNLRRIVVMELFSSKRLNMFLTVRKEEIKRLMEKLWSGSREGFSKVELKAMFIEMTFNITMRMIADKRYYGEGVEDDEEAKTFRRLVRLAGDYGGTSNPADFFPILNWLDGGKFKRNVKSLSNTFDEFLQGLVDERRRKPKDGSETTLIDYLLSQQGTQPEYYTDQIIKGLIMVSLF